VNLDKFQRIGVLPFTSEHADGQAMADGIVTELLFANIEVVEGAVLIGLFDQLRIDLKPGQLSPENLKKVGELAKIDAIIYGTINGTKGEDEVEILSVSMRMVSVANSQVIASSTFKNEKFLLPNEIPALMMKHFRRHYKRAGKKYIKKVKKDAKRAEKEKAKASGTKKKKTRSR
jgi:hypothetical protein